MSEAMKTLLEEAQHRLLQAIGALGEAMDMAAEYNDRDVLFNKLSDERDSINAIDNRLGDLRTGRNQ